MQADYGDVWLNFEGPISGGSLSRRDANNRDPHMGNKRRHSEQSHVPGRQIAARVIEFNDSSLLSSRLVCLNSEDTIPVKTETFSKSAREIRYRTSILPNGKTRLRAAFPTPLKGRHPA